jgi:redox-sensitive bicupin YhaK (pirin superfamily)
MYSFNPTNKCLFLFVTEGSIRIGDTTVARRDGLGIWGTGEITIHCAEESHFLLIETPVNQK